jgi:hypothetical protein
VEDDNREFAALLAKAGNRSFRRYEVRRINGRFTVVRNEIDRVFDLAMSEVFGTEIEPDDKDETLLD